MTVFDVFWRPFPDNVRNYNSYIIIHGSILMFNGACGTLVFHKTTYIYMIFVFLLQLSYSRNLMPKVGLLIPIL